MAEAIEITSFTLEPGVTCADFVAANAGLTQWLQRQPGFLSRDIAERDDGTVIDLLYWASLARGRAAAERILAETADSPVHRMIDLRTVQWQLAEIHGSTPRAR